jgi:hypothetical protein
MLLGEIAAGGVLPDSDPLLDKKFQTGFKI